MSGAFLVFNLIISIAIMIALILVPKFNPALSLVIASIYMGVTCGLGFGCCRFYYGDYCFFAGHASDVYPYQADLTRTADL